MIDEFDAWARQNVECCACGGTLETSICVNIVEQNKLATWKFPVAGQIDVPGYGARAVAIVCDECILKKVKIRRCVEWKGEPHKIIYHAVGELEDAKENESQMNYYFGKLFRQRMLLRAVAKESGNRN